MSRNMFCRRRLPMSSARAGYTLFMPQLSCPTEYWQAEYMISGVRDHALMLACIRHGLPADHGRGIDKLPIGVIAPFEGAFVQHLEVQELLRAFRVAMEGFLTEIRRADTGLAGRLQEPLARLSEATG